MIREIDGVGDRVQACGTRRQPGNHRFAFALLRQGFGGRARSAWVIRFSVTGDSVDPDQRIGRPRAGAGWGTAATDRKPAGPAARPERTRPDRARDAPSFVLLNGLSAPHPSPVVEPVMPVRRDGSRKLVFAGWMAPLNGLSMATGIRLSGVSRSGCHAGRCRLPHCVQGSEQRRRSLVAAMMPIPLERASAGTGHNFR